MFNKGRLNLNILKVYQELSIYNSQFTIKLLNHYSDI